MSRSYAEVSEGDRGAPIAHRTVSANGIRLHYVIAGQGEPVLLLPGWPQTWFAYRHMIPLVVAAGRQVYVLDPRGLGDSEKPATGYDLDTAAEDVHAFIQAAGLARPGGIDIVGHDVGTFIAYALAWAHPADVRRLVLSEAAFPAVTAITGIPSDAANVKTWHFAFNRLRDLPEILVSGRERAYLTWLFTNKSVRASAFDQKAIDEYVRAFSAPGAARAGFDYYRALFSEAGLARMKARATQKLTMPVLAVGGEGGMGEAMLNAMQSVCNNVTGGEIKNCGHYLADECPSEFAQLIIDFWRKQKP
jgi:pimeloyl-ACP methyl ester carboxylesterase